MVKRQTLTKEVINVAPIEKFAHQLVSTLESNSAYGGGFSNAWSDNSICITSGKDYWSRWRVGFTFFNTREKCHIQDDTPGVFADGIKNPRVRGVYPNPRHQDSWDSYPNPEPTPYKGFETEVAPRIIEFLWSLRAGTMEGLDKKLYVFYKILNASATRAMDRKHAIQEAWEEAVLPRFLKVE